MSGNGLCSRRQRATDHSSWCASSSAAYFLFVVRKQPVAEELARRSPLPAPLYSSAALRHALFARPVQPFSRRPRGRRFIAHPFPPPASLNLSHLSPTSPHPFALHTRRLSCLPSPPPFLFDISASYTFRVYCNSHHCQRLDLPFFPHFVFPPHPHHPTAVWTPQPPNRRRMKFSS